MTFLTGSELCQAIKKIAAGEKPRFAVAFWGDGSEKLLGENKDFQIICNLASGSTNPNVVEKMRKDKISVKQLDRLHAKVYLNEEAAIITSANASTNGLGLKDNAGWEEAGVLVNDPKELVEIKDWFAEKWKESQKITKEDIQRAKEIWKAKRNNILPRKSFADCTAEELHSILINWCRDSDWKLTGQHTKGKSKKKITELEKLVGDGVDIEGKKDKDVLTKGRWVLFFEIDEKCYPKKEGFYWVQLGGIILPSAIQYGKDKPLDVALPTNSSAVEPFPINEMFEKQFIIIISQKRFKQLRTDDYKAEWFTKSRLKLMKEFWGALHEEYSCKK